MNVAATKQIGSFALGNCCGIITPMCFHAALGLSKHVLHHIFFFNWSTKEPLTLVKKLCIASNYFGMRYIFFLALPSNVQCP